MQETVSVWVTGLVVMGCILALVEWTDRPPRPQPADAPALEFSETRALPVVRYLSETIGHRVAGTPGQEAAAAYLAERLRAILGVEVAIQDASGTASHPFFRPYALAYYTRNVVARIPGELAGAVLVSAHYDSPPESVGAGDDAAAVAVVLEVARALAAGPRLRHTVVFNINGAEEAGLLGAAGFLQHVWIKDVRAFVNLESAGPRGKAVVFQAGPGNGWLLDAYARAAPYPYGTVLAQDLFQSGVIPSDTDFRIYREAGLRGLDIALFEDGYAYHTSLDRVARLEPGSIQQMGANTLALVRALASGDLPGNVSSAPGVYYDVLGWMMFAYAARTAQVVTVLALVLAAAALVVARRRHLVSWRGVLVGLGVTALGIAAGLVLAIGAALSLNFVFHRPHGWFATPWLGAVAFGALALAGALLVHAVWERVSMRRGTAGDARFHNAWAGALLCWSLVLAAMTWRGLGSAYVALWWVLPAAAGLALAAVLTRARWIAFLVAFLPGAILTTQVGTTLLKLFVPVAGRFPLPIPFDPIVAGLVAIPLLGVATLGLAALQPAGRLAPAALAFTVLGVAALAATALRFPYSPDRPKRIAVRHQDEDGKTGLVVSKFDFVDLRSALAAFGTAARPMQPEGGAPRGRYEIPAGPTGAPEPALRTLASRYDCATDIRTVTLRVEGGGYNILDLRLPRAALVGWSLADSLPVSSERDRYYYARVVAPPRDGWEVALRLRGKEPVEVKLTELYQTRTTPELDAARAKLPAWTTSFGIVARTRTLKL